MLKMKIDTVKRSNILKSAEKILMEDMPLAPILFGINRSLVGEDISGLGRKLIFIPWNKISKKKLTYPG